MTLIEVVAGLALMGTLLTAVLVGGSRHLRQLKLAEHKVASVRVLDQFLTTWSSFNFDSERISDAVNASELPVIGEYGNFGVGGVVSTQRPAYRVHIASSQNEAITTGKVVRLTVSVPDLYGKRVPTAWAEVIVAND